jgi:hypothetical protein
MFVRSRRRNGRTSPPARSSIVDRDGLHDRLGQLETHLGGGTKLAIGEDDRPQVVEIFEARDGAALRDLARRVEDLALLDLSGSGR